jgi:uncharacterized protein (UPF0335 family)
MSDDLIKRVCQAWVDAGWGDESFWEHWPECPTDDTLSAKQVLDRIEELNERLTAATADAKEAEAYAQELEAKLTKAVVALRELDRRNDSLDTFNNAVHEIVSAALAELEKTE